MAAKNDSFTRITDEILKFTDLAERNTQIDTSLYAKYDVKRGLRDINGNGVLTGLTNISEICAFKNENGVKIPCDGELYYRGYNIYDLVKSIPANDNFGFEKVTYLLLFGEIPNDSEFESFNKQLRFYRTLPKNFVRDIIMKAPTKNMMNMLERAVLSLYSYDKNADDISLSNVVRQCVQLIAILPQLSVYGYNAYMHYQKNKSLVIHRPEENYSTAENILHLLRHDSQFTKTEAKVLDIALMLHAEHGGGNNSTFTMRVVTSSGTDTYSSVAASLGSLKGPRHGGANIKVVEMFHDLKKNVKNWSNEKEISLYLNKLLNKEAFDGTGLIYGMGHAVYSLSDPRCKIMEEFAEGLAEEKKRTKEYKLYLTVAKLASEIIAEKRKIYKGVSPNVDFYSGFIYSMLDLPVELYTPIFAISRISGWSAHRIEEIINCGKIIRPAYKAIMPTREFPYEKE